MKISFNWLKEYVNLPNNPSEVARILTEHSYEATAIDSDSAVNLKNIIVGEVMDADKHPNADRLMLTKTKVGSKVYEIICGAPNVRVGLKVAVAFPGVRVLDKEGKLSTLEKAVIRGVASEGMLCSERELGLGDSHNGILELPADTKNGVTLDKIFAPNNILDIDLLPDRAPDSSCYFGVAREIGGLLHAKTKLPIISLKVSKKGNLGFKLNIDNKNHCSRYIATIIEGINNGPSPDWLQDRLRLQGIKPQNLIVDATNFVLWELGQPTHAFDAEAIKGELGVQESRKGETLMTLDNVERTLPEGTLIITSNGLPVAIAGVMGGKESAVKPDTNKIVLEAALFSQPIVRRFVNKTNARTDASDRYTRGVTADHVAAGANRVIELLVKYGGGKVKAQQEFYPNKEISKAVTVYHRQIEDVLGIKVKPAKVMEILKSLSFAITVQSGKYSVKAPLFRRDINISEDVIEEVGRVLGYNNLPAKLPEAPMIAVKMPKTMRDKRKIQDTLKSAGWLEAYLYSVMSERVAMAVGLEKTDQTLEIINPLRADEKRLRTSLLPNLIGLAEAGVKKEVFAKIFEVGNVYPAKETEHLRAAGVLLRRGETVEKDFYEVKGVVENILEELDLEDISFRENKETILDPAASAAIYAGKTCIGNLGIVAPSILQKLNIRGGVVAFELNLTVIEKVERVQKIYNPPFPYPTVQRDITLLLPDNILVDLVEELIEDADKNLVQDVDFVDLYDEGDSRSVTLRVTYGSREKTLTDSEVNNIQKKILILLAEKLGAKEREVK